MPTYQVFVNQNKLNAQQKKAVAGAITAGQEQSWYEALPQHVKDVINTL